MAIEPQAPIGADPVETPDTQGQTVSTPDPIEVADDTLLRVPGMDKPVKYGEHFGGLKSQYTRATQRLNELERQYQQSQAAQADRDRKIAEYERQLAQTRQGQGDAKQDPFNQIEALPYLDGQQAAQVFRHITNTFQSAIQQRDEAILTLGRYVANMNGMLSGLKEKDAGSEFDAYISGVLKEANLPDEAADLAKEIYLAYEGDDLKIEYPNILKSRWEQVNKLVKAAEAKRVAAARPAKFVPGKGGNGAPSRPLNQGFKTPRQVVDDIWDGLQESGT